MEFEVSLLNIRKKAGKSTPKHFDTNAITQLFQNLEY